MNKKVEREVFGYCGETCPAIDDAFDKALVELNKIISDEEFAEAENVLSKLLFEVKRDGTEKIRDALREAVNDKQAAESERDDLARQVSDLESRVDSLENEVSDMESEINGMHI